MVWFLLILSCIITVEDATDRTSVTFEQAESAKAFSTQTPISSSGKIMIFNENAMLGHGSGNYFKSGRYKFILTAAHVLDHEFTSHILDGEELVPLKVMHLDKVRDIAIAVPTKELSFIKAKNFRVNRKSDLVGKTTYYAGFPQDLDKCLFKGFVSKDSKDWIIMQGFAMPGSSGSVVFDFWGRAIGVVSAIPVLFSPISPFPELVESAVIVQKIDFLNHGFLKELLADDKSRAL